MFNKTFYPTTSVMIVRMREKLKKKHPTLILDPSAGKGDIIEHFTDDYRRTYHESSFRAIEIDKELRAILRGKRIRVIDHDFLAFSGPDKFDLIIANPPFDHGDLHLLKAIDIMYRGEIVFLLNAETIKKPFTNTRKELKKKLKELNADIEFIKHAFKDAERPTGVEVALIYINIEREVEEDLFDGVDDKAGKFSEKITDIHELTTKNHVRDLVADYNDRIRIGTETILGYFRNYKKIGKYIGLNREAEADPYTENMTSLMQAQVNAMIVTIRKDFWRETLSLDDVQKRMTQSKREAFNAAVETRSDMDFTEDNIRAFILNLIDGYEDMLTDAVLGVFDFFTRHSYHGQNPREKNIHYFSGWKTNDAFKAGKKIILPIYGGHDGGPFVNSYNGKWELSWGVDNKVRDIDIVMSYFDGMSSFLSIYDALKYWLDKQKSKNVSSTFFTITVFKKGTMHLVFNDEEILRRFNVAACKGKGWLRQDYGHTPFRELPAGEKAVAESFEGRESYTEHLNQPVFAKPSLMIEAPESEVKTDMFGLAI